MGYEPGLTLVVVSYRTPNDLAAFLASFDAHPPQVPCTVVVANVSPGPEDGAVAHEWCRAHVGSHHLVFVDNVGYARACNRGAARANNEVIALFNADVVLRPGALDACFEALMGTPDWGVLGPRQVNGAGRITAGGIFGTSGAPKHRGWWEVDRGQYTDIRDDAVTVAGSAYFIKRAVWDELTSCPIYRRSAPGAEGAFLPVPLFFEETACSVHAGAHGWRNVYWGPVTVVHRFHQSIETNGMAVQARAWFAQSKDAFVAFCTDHGIDHD